MFAIVRWRTRRDVGLIALDVDHQQVDARGRVEQWRELIVEGAVMVVLVSLVDA